MEITGRIKKIGETKEYGANGFRKRELVIVTEEQYPQFVPIEFVQDKTSLLDGFQEGQQVKVAINIRGREWISPEGEAKYFVSLSGWRIETLQSGEVPQPPEMPPLDTFEPLNDSATEGEDDLPF
jgi:hypothetical protein